MQVHACAVGGASAALRWAGPQDPLSERRGGWWLQPGLRSSITYSVRPGASYQRLRAPRPSFIKRANSQLGSSGGCGHEMSLEQCAPGLEKSRCLSRGRASPAVKTRGSTRVAVLLMFLTTCVVCACATADTVGRSPGVSGDFQREPLFRRVLGFCCSPPRPLTSCSFYHLFID